MYCVYLYIYTVYVLCVYVYIYMWVWVNFFTDLVKKKHIFWTIFSIKYLPSNDWGTPF